MSASSLPIGGKRICWKRLSSRVLLGLAANPALILFISANLVNAGNLAFNVVFSRILGPEIFGDLALLLTIKLSILSVLNALQFELAARIAGLKPGKERLLAGQILDRVSGKILKFASALLLLLLIAGAWLSSMTTGTGAGNSTLPYSYLVFAISLPFMLPLCLVRGWSQGTLSIRQVVLSAQTEMIVRFGGAWIAWTMGLGLPGIAGAIALSIAAGWFFARPPRDKQSFSRAFLEDSRKPGNASFASSNSFAPRAVLLAALPWAALQMGQVLALDGDYLVTRLLLDTRESGLVAVSALVQRILFFGCFGLATALLPLAVNANTRHKMARAIAPVAAMVVLACVPVIAVMSFFPELFVELTFGSAYMEAAQLLLASSLSGSAFVVVYLIATFFMVRLSRKTGYFVLGAAALQLAVLASVALVLPEYGMQAIVTAKAGFQVTVATLMGLALYREYRKLEQE